jgi:hypothetical protein
MKLKSTWPFRAKQTDEKRIHAPFRAKQGVMKVLCSPERISD